MKEFFSSKIGKIVAIIGGGVFVAGIAAILLLFMANGEVPIDGFTTTDPDNHHEGEPEGDPDPPGTLRLIQMGDKFMNPNTGEYILSMTLDERWDPTFTYIPDNNLIPQSHVSPQDDGGYMFIVFATGDILRIPPVNFEMLDDIEGPVYTAAPVSTLAPGQTTREGEQPPEPPRSPEYSNVITLNGSSATADAHEDAVRIETNNQGDLMIRIRRPGSYTVRGTLDKGSITIGYNESFGTGNVSLTLDGVNITSPNGPAIRASTRVTTFTVTNASGKTNVLRDTRPPRPEDDDLTEDPDDTEVDEDPRRNAALFSRAPLVITGRGTLEVHGGYAHGVHARGTTLTLNNATVNVRSAHASGLRSRWGLTVSGSTVNITSNNKGIRSAGSQHGNIIIREGSTINVTSGGDAIHSENNITVMGNNTINATVDTGWRGGRNQALVSRVGMRAGGNVNVTGGTITLKSAVHGINSSGTVVVSNATVSVEAHQRGIRGQRGITLTNANVNIGIATIGLHGGALPGVSHIAITGGDVYIHYMSSAINANVPGGPQGYYRSSNCVLSCPLHSGTTQ
jgi:hypothetical protein